MNVEAAIFELVKIVTSVHYIIVIISPESSRHVILEDCGWDSCLEVVGGAASCSRGGANLDRSKIEYI